jgi:hypothetical protein
MNRFALALIGLVYLAGPTFAQPDVLGPLRGEDDRIDWARALEDGARWDPARAGRLHEAAVNEARQGSEAASAALTALLTDRVVEFRRPDGTLDWQEAKARRAFLTEAGEPAVPLRFFLQEVAAAHASGDPSRLGELLVALDDPDSGLTFAFGAVYGHAVTLPMRRVLGRAGQLRGTRVSRRRPGSRGPAPTRRTPPGW